MMAKTPADGWDRDEREAMQGLEPELEALRARHARDPEIELLRAADAEVLPDDVQSTGTTYLANDRWSRTLVDGLNDPSLALDREDESRLLDRIRRETRAAERPRALRPWLWPSLAAAAAGIIAIVWVTRPDNVSIAPPVSTPVTVSTPSTPSHVLALGKPEVKLSANALTWRSAGHNTDLLADLKPGLDAYRHDDFATARRELGNLTTKYPTSIEVFLYLGISQLQLGENAAALASLTKALGAADTAPTWFGAEAAWYSAVANERLGRKSDALQTLNSLCQGKSERTQDACAAVKALK